MRRTAFPFRRPGNRSTAASNEAGLGLFEVVVGITLLGLGISAALMQRQRDQGKNPFGGPGDLNKLNLCLASLPAMSVILKDKYSSTQDIPLDDPELAFYLQCKKDFDRILGENADPVKNPRWADALHLLREPIDNIGKCSFRITGPTSATAGQPNPVSVGLAAIIPLSAPGVVGQVQASTGERATLTRTSNQKFDGSIQLKGAAVTGDTEVTHSLTPTPPPAAGPVSCPEAVFTWKKPPEYSVTLFPPADGNFSVSTKVVVVGLVTPAPPAGTPVAITVNGSPVSPAHTDVRGGFNETIDLPHTTSLDDLKLTHAGQTVITCGNFTSPITLTNTKNPLALVNTISAAVSAAGATSNTATLAISHKVRVLNGFIHWTGACPGPDQTLPGGQIIGGGEGAELGVVPCGPSCPASNIHCTATASVAVGTSVGLKMTDAIWTLDVP